MEQERKAGMSQLLNEKPLISVIVPVYNGQDYLKKCIDSIERQTYEPLEVLIVNDGSTDRTMEVCEQLQKEYQNIRVIVTDDEGVSAARNAGLDRMTGQFVTFVDADDRIFPEMLSTLYACIAEADGDLAGCGFAAWGKEEEIEYDTPPQKYDRKIYTPEEFLMKEILGGNSRCWSKLYKRKAIGNLRFRQGLSIGEDMLFLVDLMSGSKGASVSRILETEYKGYGYFQNPKGAMNRAFRPQYMDQITCWEIAREEISRMTFGDGDKEWQSRVTAILIMAVMLTAGKLALLSAKERKLQRRYIEICHDKIKREMHVPGAFEALSKGYRLKVRLFAGLPGIYLWLYHFRKYRRQIWKKN